MLSPEEMLGRQVADRRALLGLTQATLAERVGVTVETISRLERGTVTPSLARLQQVARALGLELVELLRAPIEPTPHDRAVAQLVAFTRTRPAADVWLLLELGQRIAERLDEARRE